MEELNNDFIIHMIYSAFLNKFNIKISQDEYILFKEYQDKIMDFVDILREKNTNDIFSILENINNYLADVILMMWCLPSTKYFSKEMYKRKYKENIEKYNWKINIKHNIVKSFSIDCLTRTNYIPIHCIDYIWYYMLGEIDLNFINYDCGNYIKIDNGEILSINAEYLLELGLGNVNDIKGSFKNILKQFFNEKIKNNLNNKNYTIQYDNIMEKKLFN